MANIAISELPTVAETIEDNDLLLISKSNEDETSYTSAKIKAKKISDLIDLKLQTLINSISNLREVIGDITGNISGDTSTGLDYCKLDGNLGILGTDIPNYNQIAKYEIKFNISSMITYDHDMFLYHVAQSGFAYEKQFYSWGQYSNINTEGKKSKFVVYSDNYRGETLGHQKFILHSRDNKIGNTTLNTIIGNRLDLSDDNDHIVTFAKTGKVQCDGVDIDGGNVQYPNSNLQSWTIDEPDYLIGGNDYAHGLIGRLYYIKGYNSSNEIVANLTPCSRLNYIYLHDSVGNADINFRGSGSALAPVSSVAE